MVLNKFEAYYLFPPCMLRLSLCLYTRFFLVSLFDLKVHTYGSTCYPFGMFSLGIISQCLRSMCAFNYLTVALQNLFASSAFVS